MEPRPKPGARSPRRTPPRPPEAKSSGSKVAYDANPRALASIPCSAEPGAGDAEELPEILGREDTPRGLLAPGPGEIPVYDPEALVW